MMEHPKQIYQIFFSYNCLSNNPKIPFQLQLIFEEYLVNFYQYSTTKHSLDLQTYPKREKNLPKQFFILHKYILVTNFQDKCLMFQFCNKVAFMDKSYKSFYWRSNNCKEYSWDALLHIQILSYRQKIKIFAHLVQNHTKIFQQQ